MSLKSIIINQAYSWALAFLMKFRKILTGTYDMYIVEGMSYDIYIVEGMSYDMYMNEGMSYDIYIVEGMSYDIYIVEGMRMRMRMCV